MTAIYLLSPDLMFASRIGAAARAAGHDFRQLIDRDEALLACQSGGRQVVMIDLAGQIDDLADFVPRLQTAGPDPVTVIGYGPHVQAGRLEKAQAAGCDQVLTRGQLDRQLQEMMMQWKES